MSSDELAKIEARKELGEKFKSARESIKLTQQQVADAADVHVNFYARVERGEENPSFEKLQSIMRVLKIKSLDLF
jgi:transcriptional regulator with XRE-family HTH domain